MHTEGSWVQFPDKGRHLSFRFNPGPVGAHAGGNQHTVCVSLTLTPPSSLSPPLSIKINGKEHPWVKINKNEPKNTHKLKKKSCCYQVLNILIYLVADKAQE